MLYFNSTNGYNYLIFNSINAYGEYKLKDLCITTERFSLNKLKICKLQTICKPQNVIQSVLQTDFRMRVEHSAECVT